MGNSIIICATLTVALVAAILVLGDKQAFQQCLTRHSAATCQQELQ